jgi:rhodanese-related sulfurtransferase
LTEQAQRASDAGEESGVKEVGRDQARAMIDDGAQLVDVRSDHEWEAGHLSGARHIPLPELARRIEELERRHPVILYCRGGTRSTMATDALNEAGFDAVKLREGIVGWEEAGLELDSEDAYVAESGEAAALLQARKRAVQG